MKLQFERSTSDEVAIQFEYDSEVIEDLKRSFPYRDRKWDKDSKRWKFPADKYDNVKEWALRHYGEFEIRFLTVCTYPHISVRTGINSPALIKRLRRSYILICK